jgi:hypothetical protein
MVDSPSSDDMREQLAQVSMRLAELSEAVKRGFEAMEGGFQDVADAIAKQRRYAYSAFVRLERKVDGRFSDIDKRFNQSDLSGDAAFG